MPKQIAISPADCRSAACRSAASNGYYGASAKGPSRKSSQPLNNETRSREEERRLSLTLSSVSILAFDFKQNLDDFSRSWHLRFFASSPAFSAHLRPINYLERISHEAPPGSSVADYSRFCQTFSLFWRHSV